MAKEVRRFFLIWAALAIAIVIGLVSFECAVRNKEAALAAKYRAIGREILADRMKPTEAIRHIRDRLGENVPIGSDLSAYAPSAYSSGPLPIGLEEAASLSFGYDLPRGAKIWPRSLACTIRYKSGIPIQWYVHGNGSIDVNDRENFGGLSELWWKSEPE